MSTHSNARDRLAEDKKVNIERRRDNHVEKMNQIKAIFDEHLYGTKHERISECTALLMSQFKVTDDANARNTTALNWYTSKYIATRNKMTSIQDQQQNPIMQINSCRSKARDNFIHLSSLLQRYQTHKKAALMLGCIEPPDLLTAGDIKEVFGRYQRFVQCVKPFDHAMGYLETDGQIYNEEEFKELLFGSVSEEGSDEPTLDLTVE